MVSSFIPSPEADGISLLAYEADRSDENYLNGD